MHIRHSDDAPIGEGLARIGWLVVEEILCDKAAAVIESILLLKNRTKNPLSCNRSENG